MPWQYRTPRQGSTGWGARNRSRPPGGRAYRIARPRATPSGVKPFAVPVAVGAAAPVEDAPTAVRDDRTAESPGATTERPAPARPRGRGRLIAAAAAGLAALAIVLALLLSGGGGDDNGSSGGGGGGAQLSKDAYQDKVIDAQQDVNTKFATIGSRLPQNLDDPVKAAQASRERGGGSPSSSRATDGWRSSPSRSSPGFTARTSNSRSERGSPRRTSCRAVSVPRP